MAQIKVYKIRELDEVQHFLSGGIVGGDITTAQGRTYAGATGFPIVGQTLTFTTPAFSVTFAAGVDKYVLTWQEVAAQIKAASASISVILLGGARIGFIQKTPTTGVVMTGSATAALLGFASSGSISGKVYGSPYASPATPPYLLNCYSSNDNTHVLFTFE